MIQTSQFLAKISNLSKFRKFEITDESPGQYMNQEDVRRERLPRNKCGVTAKRNVTGWQISTFEGMKPWKLLDSEFLVNAPWLKVAKEKCELPNGKVIDDFYTLWQPDWVLILARTTEGKWVMTEQYRHGTGYPHKLC